MLKDNYVSYQCTYIMGNGNWLIVIGFDEIYDKHKAHCVNNNLTIKITRHELLEECILCNCKHH